MRSLRRATRAAEPPETWLLPRGTQSGVRIPLFDAEIVYFLVDVSAREGVEDVPAALVVDAEDGPQGFVATLALVGR